MTQAIAAFCSALFSLEGKVAVVTGGSGVLGGAMALGLARAGAKVAILGRRQSTIEAACRQITDAGGQALALAADVTDKHTLVAACETLKAHWHRVDVLVNAAGGNVPAATVGDAD